MYRLNPDRTSTAMRRVRCADEIQELQETFEKNLDLLPGDQIDPEDPRRWLLVMPTFVECKRFNDTRSRREALAAQTAQNKGLTLEDALERLRPDDDLDMDGFFARAEDNLRQGQIRLVFSLEDAPFELESIVNSLNRYLPSFLFQAVV